MRRAYLTLVGAPSLITPPKHHAVQKILCICTVATHAQPDPEGALALEKPVGAVLPAQNVLAVALTLANSLRTIHSRAWRLGDRPGLGEGVVLLGSVTGPKKSDTERLGEREIGGEQAPSHC